MHLSIYFIALFLGFVSSVAYLLFNGRGAAYGKVNLMVLVIIGTGLVSETLWEFALVDKDGNSLFYNLLYVYLGPLLMLVLFTQIPFTCELERKVWPTILAFLLAGLVISFFFQPISDGIQSYTYLIGHGLVLFFSIIFFKDILKQNQFKDVNLLSLPYFWIAALLLFSFGESYIFFILTYYFPVIGTYSMGHVFHWVRFFSGLMYLFFGLSFYAPFVFRKTYSF